MVHTQNEAPLEALVIPLTPTPPPPPKKKCTSIILFSLIITHMISIEHIHLIIIHYMSQHVSFNPSSRVQGILEADVHVTLIGTVPISLLPTSPPPPPWARPPPPIKHIISFSCIAKHVYTSNDHTPGNIMSASIPHPGFKVQQQPPPPALNFPMYSPNTSLHTDFLF